ncbi:hypothetical protein FRB98_009177 [Tulasnella sp. 332]|nr:hypothetical protein FRB98_009177 [Tulasnella sp. 332]
MEAVLSLLLHTVDGQSDAKSFLGATLTSLSASQVDHIVQTFNVALKSFQSYIHGQVTRYNNHRNTIGSNIYKLPTELLSRILLLSVPLHDWSVERLQELAHVSRRWEDVVTSTPQLWAFAKATSPRDPSGSSWRTNLNMALKNSQHSPLTVSYEDPYSGHYNRSEASVEAVGKHVHRWRNIEYTGPRFPAIISALERSSPILDTMAIRFAKPRSLFEPDKSQEQTRIKIEPEARLRHVTIGNAVITWNALSGLRTLRLRDVNDSVSQITGLLRALRICPQLEELDLSRISLIDDVTDRLAITGPTGPLHFPYLMTLKMDHVNPNLFRAVVRKIRAQAVRCLYLGIPPVLADTLPGMNPSSLIARTLERVVARTKRLDIVIQRKSIAFHSGMSCGGFQDDCSFTLELDKGPDTESVVESMARLLEIQTLTAPLHVRLGINDKPQFFSAADTFNMPFRLLEAMSTLKELQMDRPLQNASSILVQLSTPLWNDADELVWPCPQLVDLHVDITETGLAQQLFSFITNRCCRKEGYPNPTPLSTLAIRNADRRLFANVVGVGQVKFVP